MHFTIAKHFRSSCCQFTVSIVSTDTLPLGIPLESTLLVVGCSVHQTLDLSVIDSREGVTYAFSLFPTPITFQRAQ